MSVILLLPVKNGNVFILKLI